jgi:hypothetical protein
VTTPPIEPAHRAPAADTAAPDEDAADPGTARLVPAGDATAAPAPARKRPLIERLGMAVIALVLGALFAVVAAAAFIGGEPFLGVMGAIGCLMVLWVGGLTLFRG